MSEITVQVALSEFRERVYHALPPYPETITLAQLTWKIYKMHDAKKDRGRRSHVQKALHDLCQMKIAGHTADRRQYGWRVDYFRRPVKVVISRKA